MNDTASDQRMTIAASDLLMFVQKVLMSTGVPEDDARIVAECLVTANLSGVDTHGVVRLAHYICRLQNGSIRTQPKIRTERKSATMSVVDGGDGLGHVVTQHACRVAVEQGRAAGTATVVVKNSSHFGMTGYYIRHLAEDGFAAMMMTATDAFLIPFGAARPFFGTNPIAIGFPTNSIPLILDMATTSIPYGRVALAKTEARSIPLEWGLDKDGRPTDDPNQVAGLHPFAGHKGSGLAMVIDIFCNLLSGMPFGPHINKMYGNLDAPRKLGHFITVWDIAQLLPLQHFKARMSQMIEELHDLPPAEGVQRVYYPGEIEGLSREQQAAKGIPIGPGLHAELKSIGKQFNVQIPT